MFHFIAAHKIAIIATTAAVAVAGGGAGMKVKSNADATHARQVHAALVVKQQKQAKIAACRAAIMPMMNAILVLQGRTTGGVSASEYSEAFGIAQGSVNQSENAAALNQEVDSNCKIIIGTVDAAMSAYNDASSKWIACMNDINQSTCVGDSTTGNKVQADWSTAAQDISKAQTDLTGLANGVVPTPVDPGSTSTY
jgi:hypothetical protein